MNRIGSLKALIKYLMALLGNRVIASRIEEVMKLLQDVSNYEFKPNTSTYFYYDEIIDDMICLTEKKEEVDWDAELIVEMKLSDKEKTKGFWVKIYSE